MPTDKQNHKTETSIPFEIPADGMLGLLAIGAHGIIDWREKRAAVYGSDWREKLARELAEEAQSETEPVKEDSSQDG